MTKRAIARAAALVVGMAVSLPAAAEAKDAAVSHAPHPVLRAATACAADNVASLSVGELLEEAAHRLQMLDDEIELVLYRLGLPGSDQEALLIELQELFSKRQTWMQMWSTAMDLVLGGEASKPSDDASHDVVPLILGCDLRNVRPAPSP
jgi:hypothetical protein